MSLSSISIHSADPQGKGIDQVTAYPYPGS